MRSFGLRVLSGSIYVGLILGSLFLHPLGFAFVILLFSFVSLHEYFILIRSFKIHPQIVLTQIIATLWLLGCISIENNKYLLFLAMLLIFSIFIVELFQNQPNPIHNIAFSILPLIYIALPFSLLIITANGVHGKLLLLGYFIMLWANDTFAYIVGVSIGKHKLLPSISPKKTWEGYIGGVIMVIITASIFSLYSDIAMVHWCFLAFAVGSTAVFGDLVESLLKRSVDVKDSGKCMPGHGGILDRIDALLISFPFVFAYIYLFIL